MSLEISILVARRSWKAVLRRPVVLTFSLVQPLVWMLFFGFLFERFPVSEIGDLRYLDFLAPGVCAMTVLFGASQSGITWIRDLQSGMLPRMLRTATPYGWVLAGKVLADVVRVTVQALAVLILAWGLGARFTFAPLPLVLGLGGLALFATAFSCLSCAVALRARVQEVMATFIHVVNMPLLFTSTALVPSRQMPEWLGGVARLNPLSLAVDGWRGALLHGSEPPWTHLVVLLSLSILMFLIASFTMKGAVEPG